MEELPMDFTLLSHLSRPAALRRFKAKVSIYHESEDWLVYTANDLTDLERALRLRHDVFCDELQGRKLPNGIEKDSLDDHCDHLIIWDKKAGKIAGTYRLFSSLFFKRFYSEEEFEITELLRETSDPKLELGRACIGKEYRKGVVIQLLWRGIALYMMATKARFLLGCSSLQTLEVEKMIRVTNWMQQKGALLEHSVVRPHASYRADNPNVFYGDFAQKITEEECTSEVPGLVLAYHLAGAKFAPEPAIDLDFQCADFFTYLDRRDLSPLFQRRYFKEASSMTGNSVRVEGGLTA
jgi:putative hemolysin